MVNSYQKMFDAVRASDRLRKETLNMVNTERNGSKVRRFPGMALIAAVLVLVMTVTAVAVTVLPGDIKEWFVLQWEQFAGHPAEETQIRIIDQLTQVSGVSDTSGEITVTLDSFTVGDSVIWLLLKVDGKIPAVEQGTGIDFGYVELTFDTVLDDEITPGGKGFEYIYAAADDDGSLILLIRYEFTLTKENAAASGHDAELILENLLNDGNVLAEGSWSLPFSIKTVEQERLILDSAVVSAMDHSLDEGMPTTVELRNIRISATGIRFLQKEGTQLLYPMLKSVVLDDGTEVPMSGGGARWSIQDGERWWSGDYFWQLPVNLSQVVGVRFGDQVVAVK